MSRRRTVGRFILKSVGFIVLSVALLGVLAVWAEVRLDRSLSRAPFWISGARPTDGLPPADSVVLDIVSYNVWGLPFWLPDARRWERLPAIPDRLREEPADVISLQEAFDPLFRRYLIGVLGDRYRTAPDALCRQPMRLAGARDCTGGLLTLSRLPIVAEGFNPHREHGHDMRWEEKALGKGLLYTTVDSPVGEIEIVNAHLYAGRSEVDERERFEQVLSLRSLVDGDLRRPVILVGDLNSEHPALPEAIGGPPRTATRVYSFLVDSLGFIDSRPDPGEEHLTYDPERNPYGRLFYHRDLGREIFDYIFVWTPPGFTAEVIEQRRVFDEDPPLSDHYGTRARILIRRAPEAGAQDQP